MSDDRGGAAGAADHAADGHRARPVGIAHGGVLATLLDAVTGVAVQTHLPPRAGYSTIDLHVRFLRPLLPGEAGEGTGRTVRVGRTLATSEGEARDAEG